MTAGRAQAIRALAPSPEGIRAILADVPPPEDLVAWLADLCLLRGLPLEALVPDPRMLPPDSLRVFSLDPNWIDALIDGALSPASGTSLEAALVDGLDEAARGAARVRAAGPAAAGASWSGFLLRSAAVADFPGLRARAWRDPARTEALGLLRLEPVAPTVLLGIFDGPLARLELSEPAQALHFGFSPGEAAGTLALELRSLDEAGAGTPAGTLALTEETLLRPGGRRVLAVGELAAQVSAALGEPAGWGPGALALQLVDAPQVQTFAAGGRGG